MSASLDRAKPKYTAAHIASAAQPAKAGMINATKNKTILAAIRLMTPIKANVNKPRKGMMKLESFNDTLNQ